MEEKADEQLEESMRERRQKQIPNMEEAEPRRSLRLSKKKVTVGRLETVATVDDPEVLPYYMEAVKRGWAGTGQRGPRNEADGEDVPGEVSDRHFDHPEEHGGSGEDSGEGSDGVPYVEH